jgi:hypothetical protein
MLDGQRYFSDFPDEEPEQPRRLLLSDELLVTLAAIEKEISAFIRGEAEVAAIAAEDDVGDDDRPAASHGAAKS